MGTGTVSVGGPTVPIAYYLDLTMGANHQISGTGMGCTPGVQAILTITGTSGSSAGVYTMDFTTGDLGPGERTLHVSAQISGNRMTFTGIDSSTTPPTTSDASLTHGSQSDFVDACTRLVTSAASS
jgi:hypothetical protein